MTKKKYDCFFMSEKIEYILVELKEKIQVCEELMEFSVFPNDQGQSRKFVNDFMIEFTTKIYGGLELDSIFFKNYKDVCKICEATIDELMAKNIVYSNYEKVRKDFDNLLPGKVTI